MAKDSKVVKNGQAIEILERISDAFFSLDKEWRMEYVNREAEKVLGIKREEVLGISLWEIYPQAVGTQFERQYKRAMKTGKAVHFEDYYAPFGEWFEVRAYPCENGLSVYFQDVSDRKKTEEELNTLIWQLEKERVLLEEILRQMPVGVLVADAASREIIAVNDKMEKIYGKDFSRVRTINKLGGWTNCQDGKRKYKWKKLPLNRSLETGEEVDSEEVWIKDDKGVCRTISLSSAPIRNKRNNIIAGVVVVQDVTDKKKYEEELLKSEARFRQLADSMPQLVWTADSKGRVDYYNKRAREFKGLNQVKENFYGWQPVVHREDSRKTEAAWNAAVERGGIYEVEHRIKTKKSGFKWMLSRGLPVKDEDGQVVKWYGTATDIEEQKKTEEALKLSQAQFKALRDSNIIGVVAGEKGRIDSANDAFLTLVCRTEEDIRNGLYWKDLVEKGERRTIRELLKEMHEEQKVMTREIELIDASRGKKPVIIGGAEVEEKGGKYVMVALDISEQKKIEARKDEFISIASHELRTPLTSIKAYTQILEKLAEGGNYEKIKVYLDRTELHVNRLGKLVNDLLDVSKIQAGKMEFDMKKVKLMKIINEAVGDARMTINSHKIEKKNGVEAQILGDYNRLTQVLSNLISNAVKYSPGKERVEVEVMQKGRQVVVAVKDYGLGIAKDKQGRLFSRYYRSEDTATHFSGLGIGLYIAAQIIHRHKGKIWVKSQPGKGSTFYFSLPTV